jgi:hypothetical protein
LGQVETHCRDGSPSRSGPLVPETGTMRLLLTSPSWGGPTTRNAASERGVLGSLAS